MSDTELDLDPKRDQVKLADHCNIIGKVVSQTKVGDNLWQIVLDIGLLSRLVGSPQTITLYFDKPLGYSKPRPSVNTYSDSDFTIIIRHAFECVDPDGVVYYFIAAASVFETGVTQAFKADCYDGK